MNEPTSHQAQWLKRAIIVDHSQTIEEVLRWVGTEIVWNGERHHLISLAINPYSFVSSAVYERVNTVHPLTDEDECDE